MGVILRVNCISCGLDAELYVGGGLRDCRAETALSAAGNDQRLAAALQEGARFRIERRVSVCERCRKPVTAVRVTYRQPGRAAHIMAPRCPDCAARLLWPKENPDRISCPMCGEIIPLTIAGHWD